MEEVVFKGTQGLTGPKSEMDSGKRAEDRTRCPACEGCPRMQSPRRRSRRETKTQEVALSRNGKGSLFFEVQSEQKYFCGENNILQQYNDIVDFAMALCYDVNRGDGAHEQKNKRTWSELKTGRRKVHEQQAGKEFLHTWPGFGAAADRLRGPRARAV